MHIDMGEYPVAGPVPISIAAHAGTPPFYVGGVRGHRYGGLGDPQWVARAQEFRTAPPPEEEADRRGQGDPSGKGVPARLLIPEKMQLERAYEQSAVRKDVD